jgi:hypothetical protein
MTDQFVRTETRPRLNLGVACWPTTFILFGFFALARRYKHSLVAVGVVGQVTQHMTPAPARKHRWLPTLLIGKPVKRLQQPLMRSRTSNHLGVENAG